MVRVVLYVVLQQEEDSSLVGDLLGMKQQKITECGKCKSVTRTENLLLLTNLVYPEYPTLKQVVSFASVLCSSLCPEQTTPAWCERCNKYQPTSHSRRSALPPLSQSSNSLSSDSPPSPTLSPSTLAWTTPWTSPSRAPR